MIYVLTMDFKDQADCGADGRFIGAYRNEKDAVDEEHNLTMQAICARNHNLSFSVLEEELV